MHWSGEWKSKSYVHLILTFFFFILYQVGTDKKYHHADIQIYMRNLGKKTKIMKAKTLGESDNFLKTKPVHNDKTLFCRNTA